MTTKVPLRTVAPAKLTRYLLDRDHELGGPKAAFFRRFGFSADRWEIMATALMNHPDRNPVESTTTDDWGITYVVRCSIETPDGRNPCVRTVWIVPPTQAAARLVTAFPA